MQAFKPLVIGLLTVVAANAWADDLKIHGLVGLTLTRGGGDVAKVHYVNGGSQNIRGGSRDEMFGGVEFSLALQPWAIQTTVGYQQNTSKSSLGTIQSISYPFDGSSLTTSSSIRWSRYPLEAVGIWRLNHGFRLGLGLRKSLETRISTASSSAGDYKLSSSTGTVLQGEMAVVEGMSLVLRRVSEKFSTGGHRVDGSHIGLGLSFRF